MAKQDLPDEALNWYCKLDRQGSVTGMRAVGVGFLVFVQLAAAT